VILNRAAGSRHETVARQSIEQICGIPVLGAIPRLQEELFPERHLGLTPPQETEETESPLARVADVAERYLDLEAIEALARGAPPLEASEAEGAVETLTQASIEEEPVRIGVFRDAAFQFYYPENLESLVRSGGTLVEISPLEDSHLPHVDALYLGGGFPETLAVGLSENRRFSASVRQAVEEGLPVYAECGGAVYLGSRLHYGGEVHLMSGVLPVEFGFRAKPSGHGYTVLETAKENPFFAVGTSLRGHEFHYTYMLSPGAEEPSFAFRMHRGVGFGGRQDGLRHRNVLASYTHLHALGAEQWGPALIRAARRFRSRN
jgi:cobyrinic acid a,c-diamide synthase